MSVIFQDPFMSEEQSFDKLLMELDYSGVNIETSIWQQYLNDFEEDLKPAVWKKYVDLKPLDTSLPLCNTSVDGTNVNKDANDKQLDALIEEIVSWSHVQHQEEQNFGTEFSKMLQTEPSTLTVIDQLVNTSDSCSEVLDLDKFHQDVNMSEPSFAAVKTTNPSNATPLQNELDTRSKLMPHPRDLIIPKMNRVEENVPKMVPPRLRRLNSNASYASESSESSHYSSDDETNQGLSSDDDVRSIHGSKSQRIPQKPVKKRKRYYKTRKPRLCQYLAELLNNPERNPSMMEWVDREEGIFRFTDSGAVARMWGQRRHKPDMKYENFARSLRTYIAKGVLRKLRSKLVYGFSIPSNWINISQN